MKALDINGKLINVEEAKKNLKYYCPLCNKQLVLTESILKVRKFVPCYCLFR